MAQNPDAIYESLAGLIEPQARERLLARGMARSMVWRNGKTPEDGPAFAATLTSDLLDYGYGVLAMALELCDANRTQAQNHPYPTDNAFRVAAEAIEAAVRRGDTTDPAHGFHLVVSAAAFHLAGYAARSYSLLPPSAMKNLAPAEKALGHLLRRDLAVLRVLIIGWHSAPDNGDDAIAARLLNSNDDFGPEDAALVSLTGIFYRALGLADTAFLFGNESLFREALERMQSVAASAGDLGNVPTWWAATLASHLLLDLWKHSLHKNLPDGSASSLPPRWSALRRDYIALLGIRKPPHIDLWPSQLSAARRATDPTDDLVIALPTSAGKTRIAELCILRTLADSKRIIYITPLPTLAGLRIGPRLSSAELDRHPTVQEILMLQYRDLQIAS